MRFGFGSLPGALTEQHQPEYLVVGKHAVIALIPVVNGFGKAAAAYTAFRRYEHSGRIVSVRLPKQMPCRVMFMKLRRYAVEF